MQLNILYQDSHIIVCEKPAGIPTQSKSIYTKDMVTMLKTELAKHSTSDTEPYLGLIHRLDQPVGGIMVFAKTPQASKELSIQIQKNTIHKHYLAVITNDLSNEKGKSTTLVDELIQNKRDNTSRIVPNKTNDSKTARLTYTVLDTLTENEQCLSLIDIDLITGRHHQIRVQTAAHLGGIWGDKKYNTKFQDSQKPTTLCLYSYHLDFIHPIHKKPMHFEQLPEYDHFKLFSLA